MGLVEIVNPNGRKGLVAPTSKAATAYKTPPASRRRAEDNGTPAPAPAEPITQPSNTDGQEA